MTITQAVYFNSSTLKACLEVQQGISPLISSLSLPELPKILQASDSLTKLQKSTQSFSKMSHCGAVAAWAEYGKQTSQITQLSQTLNSFQAMNSQLVSAAKQLREQSWISEFIPSLDMSLRNAISISYPELSRAEKQSAILSALEEISSIDISGEIDSVEEICVADSELDQLTADIREALDDPPNWQQRLMTKLLSWKARNPIVAYLLQQVLNLIILEIITLTFSWTATTLKSVLVHEAPSTSATVVVQIEGAQNVEVIGDAPYYYWVEFNDPRTGQTVQGYISKRMVTPLQSDTP